MKNPILGMWLMLFAVQVHAHGPQIATELDEALGLYQARQFQQATGRRVEDQRIPSAALWYFKDETIAIPAGGKAVASYSHAIKGIKDILPDSDFNDLPSVIWIGSNALVKEASIDDAGKSIALNAAQGHGDQASKGHVMPFHLVPKIPANLSYWNADTLHFFQQRPIRIRGEITERGFTARTVWPLDFRLDLAAQVMPLNDQESLKSLVQADQGGAQASYYSRLLWQENPRVLKQVEGKAVLALMLNGAQGDDDEAHGGHFAVVTGRMEADGSYANWLVNNYYNLGANSEKGIIAGITPLDNYLADLNSGQSYYRPSYMLVAMFKSDRLPSAFQAVTNRIYNHFYRNDFLYDHSHFNCAGISIDTLRAIGWEIPTRGVESQLKAIAAYFYIAATEGSLSKARDMYDYFNTESTRLFPAVAFDAIGEYLLAHADGTQENESNLNRLSAQLKEDIEAIYFVRIPQIPSSRAYGLAPVYSIEQYLQQAPADRAAWKIVPTTPNPLPETLKSGLTLESQKSGLVPFPVAGIVMIVMIGFVTFFRKGLRNRQRKKPL
jgi:hypothetical protein